jgi:hypothetical protein
VRGATVRGGLQRGRGKNEKEMRASSAAGLGAERRGGTVGPGAGGRADGGENGIPVFCRNFSLFRSRDMEAIESLNTLS